jgi:hypothetical protein
MSGPKQRGILFYAVADHDQKIIEAFFAAVSPWDDAYKKFASLSYFAISAMAPLS